MTIALAAVLLGLAGCGGEQASSSSSEAGGVVAAPATAASGGELSGAVGVASPAADAAKRQATGSAGSAAAAVPAVQLIRTADVVLEVDQLATAAARVRAIALSVGGTVSSEVTAFPDAPTGTTASEPASVSASGDAAAKEAGKTARPGESVIVIRVPVASLDSTIERVVAVGRELSRTSAAQDVTADLADLGSRVKTQQASVERVRQLLAKATSLQDIVLLESELTRRQSDLEALQARQASLADRAALSTLTVTLRTPETVGEEPDGSGFLAGLKSGWSAVIGSTTVVLTVLGALLPVVVLVALIGVPIWWAIRRRRRRRPAPPPPANP